jgi:hypothetical protein
MLAMVCATTFIKIEMLKGKPFGLTPLFRPLFLPGYRISFALD